MLDIGLERKKGTQGGFKPGSSTPTRETPLMTPDALPKVTAPLISHMSIRSPSSRHHHHRSSSPPPSSVRDGDGGSSRTSTPPPPAPHWDNSQKSISSVKRRSPIMMKKEQQQHQHQRPSSGASVLTADEQNHPHDHHQDDDDVSFSISASATTPPPPQQSRGFNFGSLDQYNSNNNHNISDMTMTPPPPHQTANLVSDERRRSSTTSSTNNQTTPSFLRKKIQEMQYSPLASASKKSNSRRRTSSAQHIGSLNREKVSISPASIGRSSTRGGLTTNDLLVTMSPVHFSGARSKGSGLNKFNSGSLFAKNGGSNNQGITTSSDVSFMFLHPDTNQDPIKEQLRRADAVIASIPSKTASPLPSVIDSSQSSFSNPNSNPHNFLSSAAVLDGLVNRTALLEHHDKSEKNKERTANMILGTHLSALFDLSRSLALTDPNAAEVVKRVHDVMTSQIVVKSVEEPLERVSSLYDQAKRHAADAREQCIDLRSQLLDCQSQVQALKRQVRKRDDMIEYLTSAYSLPTVFKDTTSDNQDFVSQTLAEEASPSALINQKKNAERRRKINEQNTNARSPSPSLQREDSISSHHNNNNKHQNQNDDNDDNYDSSKSLQEQFQVVIPSQEEKAKKR